MPISICELTKWYNVKIHINTFLQVSYVGYIYIENVISDMGFFLNWVLFSLGQHYFTNISVAPFPPFCCTFNLCDFVLQFVPSSPIRIPSSRLHQIKQVSTDSSK